MAGILDSIRNFFGRDNDLPGIEFHPASAKRDRDLEAWVYDLYTEAFEAIDSMRTVWAKNRRAFMCATKDHYGGWGTVTDAKGDENQYSSAVVADKIGDLVAMQIQNKPTVYPLPNVSEEVELADMEGRVVVPGYNPNNPDNLTQVGYVSKWVEAVFADIRRSQHESTKNVKVALEGRLSQLAITKQYPKMNKATGQIDIKLDVVLGDNFAMDPSATEWEDVNYVFHKTRKTFYEVASKYPEYKEEIQSAVKGAGKDKNDTPGTDEEARDYKGKVVVVEGYFKDETTKKIPNPDYDPETGEDEKTIEVYKYPTGRRITFLVDSGDGDKSGGTVILKDEENPFDTFPFAVFAPDPIAWSIYGRCQATPLASLQLMKDNAFQQGQANIRACANNRIYYRTNALVDADEIKNAVGEKIECNDPDGIKDYGAKPILGDIVQYCTMLDREAERESGVNATSEGRTEGSVSSGRAFSILSENTNRKVKPSKDAFAEHLEDRWRQIATYALDAYEEGRFLRTSDEDRLPVKLPFTLRDFVDAIDVQVDSESHFPSDPVSRFNAFMTLAQTRDGDGFPFVDRDAVLKELKFAGSSDAIRRINQKIVQMQQAKQMQQIQGPQGVQSMEAGSGGSMPTPPAMENLVGGMGPAGEMMV